MSPHKNLLYVFYPHDLSQYILLYFHYKFLSFYLANCCINYFGEKHTLPCGQCDICLAHKARAMKEARFVQLEEQIVTLLTETPLSITQLMKQLQAPEEEVLQVIRHLLDHQKLTQTSTMKIAVK